MTRRHHRALRGAAAAWVATIVAATSHTLSGGGAPSFALIAALAVLVTPVAVLLVGRRPAAWRVGVTVLASQAAFHTAFAFLGASTSSSAPIGHAHHTALSVDVLGGATILAPDAAMLAGHLIAALGTMAGLYGGERMLRAVARGIRSVLARARALAPLDLPRPHRVRTTPPHAGTAATILSDLSRRGPPAFVTATL